MKYQSCDDNDEHATTCYSYSNLIFKMYFPILYLISKCPYEEDETGIILPILHEKTKALRDCGFA